MTKRRLSPCALCSPWLLFFLTIAPMHAYTEGSPQRYMTREEAFRVILPGADRVVANVRHFSPDARARIERRASRKLEADTVEVFVGYRGTDTIGYAIIDDEIGLHHPITFGVGVTRDRKLVDCVVMVFRESRGMEIRDARFRRQMAGKGPNDPIRINRDIVNVTGATYSSRAATDAVRKAIAICQELFP